MKQKMTKEKKISVQNSVGRLIFAALCVLVQLGWLYLFLFVLSERSVYISAAMKFIAFLIVLSIYGRPMNSSMKIPWLMLILIFPLFGGFLYLIVGLSGSTKKMRERFERIDGEIFKRMPKNIKELEELSKNDMIAANNCRYIQDCTHIPVYRNSDTIFFDDALKGLKSQLDDLKKARNFIFMEYHAIEDTKPFNEVEKILKEKAANGVEVRIFYDDMGSIGYLNSKFINRLKSENIKIRVFNPVTPLINVFLNNRDHRKITVIDGKVAYTGGYNLANEYFNFTHPYGMWKDTGIKITGDAVSALTILFLEMWNSTKKTTLLERNIDKYFPKTKYKAKESESFIQPYYDSPLDHEAVGENVYMNIISGAKKYVWITTPYLIITDEMSRCLELAAKKGIDVRIITPGIPDKKLVYKITRSYYTNLINAGVKIYEYSPGFIHAKQFVADDIVATCGTINLDFRSLYHHFENGVYIYNSHTVSDIKQDFINTFKVCNKVKKNYGTRKSGSLKLGQCLLRLISPLL